MLLTQMQLVQVHEICEASGAGMGKASIRLLVMRFRSYTDRVIANRTGAAMVPQIF